jgi:hypothetical protein
MYKDLKHTARAMRNFCIQLEQDINSKALTTDMIERYFHELEQGDYSLMSALHQAWHEALNNEQLDKFTEWHNKAIENKYTKTPTNTGEMTQ